MGGQGYWTEDRIKRLTMLWNMGLSAAQASAHFPGQSRNSIIGKWVRLGLRRGTNGHVTPGAGRPPAASRPRVKTSKPLPPPEPIDEDHEPVAYSEASESHCRALLDRRGPDGLLMCCGRQRMRWAYPDGAFVSSYCPRHDRQYTPGRYKALWKEAANG